MKAYHFTGDTLRDGRPIPPIGVWLEHDGPVVPCESGLHGSRHPFDALQYASGSWLHRVEIEGDIVRHGTPEDKVVGRRRKIIATIDSTQLCYEFARKQALSVVHLWEAPDIVRRFLETGDESLRSAAWDAAWDAAWSAARAAAWAAARDASRSASRSAAWDVAWDAAWAASRSAARDAAWDAAWDAARAAARDAARKMFKHMVLSEFKLKRGKIKK